MEGKHINLFSWQHSAVAENLSEQEMTLEIRDTCLQFGVRAMTAMNTFTP